MSLLALSSVKPHLKITGATDETVLQAKLDAAESFVARRVGGAPALSSTSITETLFGWGALSVTKTPMLALSSVTGEKVGALTLTDLAVDLAAGVIRPKANTWTLIADYYTCVYTTGYATAADVPLDLVEAVRLMTQHFYSTQRGPNTHSNGADEGVNSYNRAMAILDGIASAGFA